MPIRFTKDECDKIAKIGDQMAQIASNANNLSGRLDAFFARREAERKRKEAKRDAKRAAKRDGDDPLASYTGAPPDFREDNYAPEEREELRTGALSKDQ